MQFLSLRFLKSQMVYLLMGSLLFVTGCEDDDHDHDHDEDHTDADGFVLEDESGTVVYREFEGTMTGSVTLSVGETLELTVHFLDHNGNEIEHSDDEHDDHDDSGGVVVSGNDATIAVVEVEGHDEEEGDDHGDDDHGDEHGNALHVEGISAGSTSFRLQLMHEGHADYTSTNLVPVVVN